MTASTPSDPAAINAGFTLSRGEFVQLEIAYQLTDEVFTASVFIQVGRMERRHWKTVQRPPEYALKAAEELTSEARCYAKKLAPTMPERPSEILSFDDLVEHIRLRVEKRLH